MTLYECLQSLLDFWFQVCVVFPYSALTVPRQRQLLQAGEREDKKSGDMGGNQFIETISDRLIDLCTSSESVSTILAQEPTLAPSHAWKKLYEHHAGKLTGLHSIQEAGKGEISKDALERASKCGKWGPTRPSELFLRIYHDAINSIEEDPAHAVVSPSLMGSCGVMPLAIISTVPDIVRHMSNLIVRAEKEVILATNYWQNSNASKFITDAIRELSRRAGQRGTKIVMKVIYDRGSPKQLIEPHYIVSEKSFTGKAVGLPAREEIPNIDMEVMNYHHPMLGTFHAKYMVVDRKIAILQSNNIQDNDNLEMMIHLEGPIVDSMYDMALISWHKKLEPPLPSHNSPAVTGGLGCFGDKHEALLGPNGQIRGYNAVVDPRKMKHREAYTYTQVIQPGLVSDTPQQSEDSQDRTDILTGPTTTASLTHPHPRKVEAGDASQNDGIHSIINQADSETQSRGATPDNQADRDTRTYLNTGDQEIPQTQIQEPTPQSNLLPEHTTDDPHWDDDIAGEIARVQTAVSAKPGETRMQAVNRHLNHTINVGFPSDAPECAPEEEMTPYIPHPPHEPFPIAMVNRPPYGSPNHNSVSNPQNAAWLSALRNAKKNVFIQSPTVNAEPLIPAIIDACERGVDVYCYVCLGYNDAGELLPMQGGHNDMVAHHLYTSISDAGRQHLHWFWYVGKDQTKPVHQSRRKRSCHIKLMIVDEHIGIAGSGNQDTQSWFHSQEVNVMLDNVDVCRAWIDGLRRNQNTHLYGAVNKENGEWRDREGKKAEGAIGPDPGRFSWTTGLVGAVKRLQGTGGF